MKPAVKWFVIPVGAVVVLILGAVGYLFAAFPNAGPVKPIKVEKTPELVARGKYIAEHVSVCMDCHAERDWTRYSGPPKAGTLGSGGEHFSREMGLPGDFYSKNITPGGVGDWSDGELARAITTGITKEGRAMFPIMPYKFFRHMCERDLQAVIAYVRTLSPSDKQHPESDLDFPVNLIVRTMPAASDPWQCTEPGDKKHGEYLTTIAGCVECHTEQDKGQTIGEPFAGGWRFPLPSGGHITSKNITPDKETGIGKWTRDQFIQTFQARAAEGGSYPVPPGGRQTIMPWEMYGGMTPEDLGAIYDYLRTVKPVSRKNVEFEPAK